MNVDMTLIGFAREAPHSRMGLHLHQHDIENDFDRWAILTEASQLCIVDGCGEPTTLSKPHGWTCAAHDWATKKRPDVAR